MFSSFRDSIENIWQRNRLGFGMFMEDTTSKEYWIPLLMFTCTGLGFIGSGLLARKYEIKN